MKVPLPELNVKLLEKLFSLNPYEQTGIEGVREGVKKINKLIASRRGKV